MAREMRLYVFDHQQAMVRNAPLDAEQCKVLNALSQALYDLEMKIGLPLFPDEYKPKSRPRAFDPQDEYVPVRELWENQQGRCFYCGSPLLSVYAPATKAQRQKKTFAPDEPRPFQVDHAQPRARGGKNRRANYRLSCMECNKHKGVLTEAEFMAVIAHRNGGAPSNPST
jgi:5-methylcytosine-specific restriction endonuclease McrA